MTNQVIYMFFFFMLIEAIVIFFLVFIFVRDKIKTTEKFIKTIDDLTDKFIAFNENAFENLKEYKNQEPEPVQSNFVSEEELDEKELLEKSTEIKTIDD